MQNRKITNEIAKEIAKSGTKMGFLGLESWGESPGSGILGEADLKDVNKGQLSSRIKLESNKIWP